MKNLKILFVLGLFTITGCTSSTKEVEEVSSDENVELAKIDRIKLVDLDGKPINLKELKGKRVFLNLWATWCKPCREEMPMLSGLHERLAGKGFTVLGIAMDDVQQAREFVDEFQISYPNAVGGVDVMATGVLYGNHSGLLPYSVLIDRSGIVRWTFLGELESSELEAQINDLL